MPAPTNAERVKASKLRSKVHAGNALSEEDRKWLEAYEQAKKSSTKKPIDLVEVPVPRGPVRGPQLALDSKIGKVSSGVHVNVTQPVNSADSLDPKATMWVPTMPEAPADAEPPPEGAPKPPPVGTPLVDHATPTLGQGDPHAAEQFAGFVLIVMKLGVAAARELASDYELPDQARMMLASAELEAEVSSHVSEAAKRVAMKYGFRSIPLADEGVVAAALVGSGFLVFTQQKRKKLNKGKAPTRKAEADDEQPKRDEPATPTSGLNTLWGRS